MLARAHAPSLCPSNLHMHVDAANFGRALWVAGIPQEAPGSALPPTCCPFPFSVTKGVCKALFL
jgi:hypothetical protein